MRFPAPVQVPRAVFAGIEAVRKSGVANMYDRKAVQYWAAQWDYDETALWLEAHLEDYTLGIHHGFEVDDAD